MGIKTVPFIHRGNFVVTGTLRTDASAYFTGPVEAATGIVGDASMNIARRTYHASGIDVTLGGIVSASSITACGVGL